MTNSFVEPAIKRVPRLKRRQAFSGLLHQAYQASNHPAGGGGGGGGAGAGASEEACELLELPPDLRCFGFFFLENRIELL